LASQKVLEMAVSREKEEYEEGCLLGGIGLTYIFTAFSGKSGKNQGY